VTVPDLSIQQVAQLSGISAHTLRMWERRYRFPVPRRTSGGARRYSEGDVEALKLVARALAAGYRAGDVVGKPRADLLPLFPAENAPAAMGAPPAIDRALAALATHDVDSLRDEVRRALATLGPLRFLVDYATPLALRVGELWEAGALSIHAEHLTTELLSTQLRGLLIGYETQRGRPRVLLTTLPGEQHGLALEVVAVYLALQQAAPRLLGVSTPVEEIVAAAVELDVDVVGVSVSLAAPPRATTSLLRKLLRELPRRHELWIGGAGAVTLPGARAATTWADLEDLVRGWRRDRR
jgi:DNA-binding transcriptional MerR regulator/methylmalonyl-CoA mutase cobalamin-binding subunit